MLASVRTAEYFAVVVQATLLVLLRPPHFADLTPFIVTVGFHWDGDFRFRCMISTLTVDMGSSCSRIYPCQGISLEEEQAFPWPRF